LHHEKHINQNLYDNGASNMEFLWPKSRKYLSPPSKEMGTAFTNNTEAFYDYITFFAERMTVQIQSSGRLDIPERVFSRAAHDPTHQLLHGHRSRPGFILYPFMLLRTS